MSAISVFPYAASAASAWNELNATANGGHFLFDRRFMEYHASRFADASLVFERDGAPIAIFPANRDSGQIQSHQGLTFGGLVHAAGLGIEEVLAVFDALIDHSRRSNVRSILYKAVPHIYHRAPADEALYALFRHGGRCVRREASATIDYRASGVRSRRRERGVRKSIRAALRLGWDDAWEEYWAMLTEVLLRRHNRLPVHTMAEIRMLADRFPDNIRLFAARKDGAIVAGVVMFETPYVAHAQYIAASPYGQTLGALDGIFDYLIGFYAEGKRYFDFGISTEESGTRLNAGLAGYKQEWGATCVVHDTFEIGL